MEENKINGRKVTIDIVKANVFSLVILLVSAILFLVPFFLIWKDESKLLLSLSEWVVLFVLLIVGIAVHELIHGLTWVCFARSGWKSISFGVIWKLLTPYCHCNEPLPIRGYMIGAMMPCIVLGIIPAIAALFLGNFLMVFLGIFFITGAAGDIWMTWLLTKENPKSLVLDHPSEAGFYILDED